MKCSFDASQCLFDCVLGYEQDPVHLCPISCNCAVEGVFETDIKFDTANIETIVAVSSSYAITFFVCGVVKQGLLRA